MAACMTPFAVRDSKTQETQNVPCGKCPNCKARRVSAWSFRLMQEDKVSVTSYFLTLTYSNDTVPITKKGFMTVRKRDLQLFFKRLRKLNPETKIKYYAAAEYGDKTNRPYYHIIIFNALVETFQPAWKMGEIHYGFVSEASVGYSLKYISKPSKIPLHANDDRQRVFALMSKGLGIAYITEAMVKWHKSELTARMYCNLKDGKKIAMPRYYKTKIYTDAERKRIGVRARIEALKEEGVAVYFDEYVTDYGRHFIERQQIVEELDPNFYRDKFEREMAAFRRLANYESKPSKI